MIEISKNIIVFIFGASIGSFLNVLIDRLPKNQSILGRSHCDHCHKKLTGHDLIPVFSFFVLKGKSRCCHKKLSWQYPLVEMITGISFLLIFNFQFSMINQPSMIQLSNNWILGNWKFIDHWLLMIGYLGVVSCLIVIFVSDLKYHLISDYVQAALFAFSVLLKFVIPAKAGIQIPYQVVNDILSALIVALPIFLIYYLSRERAMGLGDVFLALNIGFLLGWQAGFLALYMAFVTGAIFGLFLILLKRKKIKSKISFGPFLVIGTVAMLFWGKEILEIIKRVYGF